MSVSRLSTALPAAPLGSTRENLRDISTDLSTAFPLGKQMTFRLNSAYQRTDDVALLRSAFKRAVEVAGGVEWLAVELGKPISYASKISEALNGVAGRHIQLEEWLPCLFSSWPAMEIIFATLCGRTNRELPKAKRIATDAERADALVKKLREAGPAGEAILKAAADDMGVDVEGLTR